MIKSWGVNGEKRQCYGLVGSLEKDGQASLPWLLTSVNKSEIIEKVCTETREDVK